MTIMSAIPIIAATGAIVFAVIAITTSRTTVERGVRAGGHITNAGAATQASLSSAVVRAAGFARSNPLVVWISLAAVFLFALMVQPSHWLPVEGDVARATFGELTASVAVDAGGHYVGDGDGFEVRLILSGPKPKAGGCQLTTSAYSATALAPGQDIATIQRLKVDIDNCVSEGRWLVTAKRPGRVLVGVTVSRLPKGFKTSEDLAALTVAADVAHVLALDVMVSATFTILVALIAALSAKK
jgi:hypothetical protein